MLPKYTITKDDENLVDERVHSWAVEEFEDTQHKWDQIQYELADMRKLLENIRDISEKQKGQIEEHSHPPQHEKQEPRLH
jgi:hypothetical protein